MKKILIGIILLFAISLNSNSQDPYMGEIRMFAGNYAPQGWFLCWGQTLQISQYSALFSILGITYGGNGQTTFCLPDLRGRAPIGWGQGTGLSNYTLGQTGGSESITLNTVTVTTGRGVAVANVAIVDNRAPYIAMNFIICYEGIYPARP